LLASVRVPSSPQAVHTWGGRRNARPDLGKRAVGPYLAMPRIPPPLLLGLFIVIDVGQALTMDWAEKRGWDQTRTGRQYVRQTVPVVTSSLAILTGLIIALCFGGLTGLRECFKPSLIVAFLPVSLCFALGLSLKLMAVNHFQAGTIKIMGQLRLPMLALVSTLVLTRRYSLVQWQVIGMVTTSCLAFVLMKGQGRHQAGKSWKWSGLSELFAWVVLNVVGGIVAEHAYKSGNAPFYAQKVCEDVGHLLIGSVMLLVVVPQIHPEEDIKNREERPNGFFDAWDHRTVLVVVFLFLDAWIGNLLLKEFSGVTRSVAKAVGISLVYFVSLFYAKDRRKNPALTLAAMLVIQSSLLFSFV